MGTTDGDLYDGTDYRGVHVAAFTKYVEGFSVGSVTTIDAADELDAAADSTSTSIAIGVAIALVGMVVLIIYTSNMVSQVEADWLAVKHRIERDMVRYSDTVGEVLPSHVAQLVLKGGAVHHRYAQWSHLHTGSVRRGRQRPLRSGSPRRFVICSRTAST